MPHVITDKQINLDRLSTEVGEGLSAATTNDVGILIGVGATGLDIVGPKIIYSVTTPESQLQAAIDAHVYIDRPGREVALRDQALNAIQNNRDFLANPTPTNLQILNQVRFMTRQLNAIIRYLFRRFDEPLD